MKQEEFDKIDRYINGVADETDREFVESLFSDGENNLYLRNRLKKDWESLLKVESSPGANLAILLDRIHHIIRKTEIRKTENPLNRMMRVYMKAAAILLIPLVVTGGLIYSYLSEKVNSIKEESASTMIYAPMGSRVSFNLPDGTKGMLNSGSRLDYTMPFAPNRQVKLAGEAWFEVKHYEDSPFEIRAGSSTVKVLGTSFNLSAYPAEDYIEVVLDEGEVEFLNPDNKLTISLQPSERLVYQSNKISKSVVDPKKYNAWTEGKLVFRGDPMAEVVRRIERWYNVKIIIADKELAGYSFRATFEDDTLEDVMKFLAMTSPIRYKISPRKIMPDGTYSKEEVVIYKNN